MSVMSSLAQLTAGDDLPPEFYAAASEILALIKWVAVAACFAGLLFGAIKLALAHRSPYQRNEGLLEVVGYPVLGVIMVSTVTAVLSQLFANF